jgi:DNA-binding CsgD family transcriptional regulator
MSTLNIDGAAEKLTEAIFSGENKPLNETLRTLAADLGLCHISYIRMAKGQSDDLSTLTAVVTYSVNWQFRYFERQYIKIDPVIKRGRLAVLPFDWQELITEDAAVIAFLEDAMAHDIGRNGLSIPIRGRKDWVSIVSFTSNHTYEEWQEYKNTNIAKLNIISLLIDNTASKDFALPRPDIKLSERELQCLIWSARGKTYKDIAEILGVSFSTVKFYLDTARHKLNCINVTHAVAVAIASGIIPAQALKY